MESNEGYKVILADDEPIILRSLKAAIPWQTLRLTVAGEARNGEEALSLVEREAPHIVISDIRMPALDGISLMKQVMPRHAELVFIFISGYGEFDYVREALRQGAFDYLLKPIDHDELTGMLQKAVLKLDAQRQRRLENERLQLSVQGLSLLARERLFAELIEGHPKPLQQLQWLENSDLEQPYCLMLVQLDHLAELDKRRWKAEEKQLWFFAVRNILEEWSAACGGLTVFPFHSGEWIVLFPALADEEKRRLGEDMISQIKRYSKLLCSAGISRNTKGVEQLSAAYGHAKQALYGRFYSGDEGVYLDAEPAGRQDIADAGQTDRSLPAGDRTGSAAAATGAGEAEAGRYPKAIENELLECVRTFDEPRLPPLFDKLKVYIESQAIGKEVAERFIIELAVILYRQLEHMNALNPPSITPLLSELKEADTLDAMLACLKRTVGQWLKQAAETGTKPEGQTLIEMAKQYIAGHYYKDMGIDEAAEWVGLSTSHFCALFKQISGYTFLEYLTECRIEKAKYILANTDVKVYQVAPMVGYQDPRYFTQVFKKVTGRTPSEYRTDNHPADHRRSGPSSS